MSNLSVEKVIIWWLVLMRFMHGFLACCVGTLVATVRTHVRSRTTNIHSANH